MATKKNYSVDSAFIKAAHKDACSTWKNKIEKKFPDVFKPKVTTHNFGSNASLNTAPNGPLFIGHGMAPRGLEGKCLVVNDGYKMEVKTHNGKQILVFKKVK